MTAQWLPYNFPYDCTKDSWKTAGGLPTDCLRTVWRMADQFNCDSCQTAAWWQPDDGCLTTAWWLPEECPQIDRGLSDECPTNLTVTVARRLPDNCLMINAWGLPDDCLTTAWRWPDNYLTLVGYKAAHSSAQPKKCRKVNWFLYTFAQ